MLSSHLARFLHIGQKIPSASLMVVSQKGGKYEFEKDVDSEKFFKGKRVVVVGYPGAFTPTCSNKHLPEYIQQYSDFKAKNVEVVPISVNDPFVVKAFAHDLNATMPFIADADGSFTKALDAGVDLTEKGLGYRARRFSFVVEDGTITQLNDENSPGMTDISRAETVLKGL